MALNTKLHLPGAVSSSLPFYATQRSEPSRWRHAITLAAVLMVAYVAPTGQQLQTSLSSTVDHLRWLLTPLPKDPHARARALLRKSPIIDSHIDLGILVREKYQNQPQRVDLASPEFYGHVTIPALKKGLVGGFAWSVYVACPEDSDWPADNTGNFSQPSFRVRDTLEQFDISKILIDKYPETFKLVKTEKEWRQAAREGKVASFFGVEGGHQLGASLSTLRLYYELGARYVTLTHTCNSPLADTCGYEGSPVPKRWGGLSPFGELAIKEMNRLGMMVDVSHTSPESASQALSLSKAPVIFSHSNARAVHRHVRNVPDHILARFSRIGKADSDIPGGDAIIMLNFSPDFVSEIGETGGVRANISLLADHADHIKRVAGAQYVGIGSDFDGILKTPVGLENVSKYPDFIAELIQRGWTDDEVRGVASENWLRVWRKVEAVKYALRHEKPYTDIFEPRLDGDMKPRWPGDQ
ncbi:hypothetical protein OIV83_000818 [Microbotryomycetes sp. JL201]|nr:hypothetical protein OIV83_000818 [Microbotryomycetes sp. JL201]